MNAIALPHQTEKRFLTDAGLETELVFIHKLDLPCFAAFMLLRSEQGKKTLRDYYEKFAALAANRHCGCVLETPTWRAQPDWCEELGITQEDLIEANRDAVSLMQSIREEYTTPDTPMPISGNLGPRGDGYVVGETMSEDQAREYHSFQVRVLADTGADFISAFTLTYPAEAIGIVKAAQTVGLPVVISFTVETDGLLPNGQSLQSAIAEVDAATDSGPAYYMINCAHPEHFINGLADEPWVQRLGGLRANASRCSHEELDNSEVLDDGNPVELGQQYRHLIDRFPAIKVLGGCCGTDYRHVREIAQACC